MNTILALDLGTRTGYCVGYGDGAAASGVADFKPKRFEGGGMRYLRFRNWLTEMHSNAAFTSVYFEEVRRHIGTDAAHIYGGLMGHLTAWCEERKMPYSGVPVGTIKKSATGRGNANKEAMIAAVTSWGYAPIDDNEADAIALFHHVQGEALLQ
jgi:Holliday junction resolvasome RuvABC endonuclease subunit